MTPLNTHQEHVAQALINNLNKRQMDGFYCKSVEEVQSLVASLVASDSSVSFGGSMTLEELGILSGLRSRNDIHLIDRSLAKDAADTTRMYHDALNCDTYLMSSNAITKSGELLNIDGNGNRVAALIYGPAQVLVIAGMNKVCEDLDDAMKRVRNTATPANCLRLNRQTPCSVTGTCADCLSPDCICNQIVTTRRSGICGRIKVILVEGSWGY